MRKYNLILGVLVVGLFIFNLYVTKSTPAYFYLKNAEAQYLEIPVIYSDYRIAEQKEKIIFDWERHYFYKNLNDDFIVMENEMKNEFEKYQSDLQKEIIHYGN